MKILPEESQSSGLGVLPLMLWLCATAAAREGAPPAAQPAAAEALEYTEVYRSQFEKFVEIDRWEPTRTAKAPNGRGFLGEYAQMTPLLLKVENLPVHKFVRLRADLLILKSWDGTTEGLEHDSWGILDETGPLLMITTFSNPQIRNPQALKANQQPLPARARSQSFPDEYPFAEHPPATGASGEGNKLGFKFKKHDIETTDTIYKIDITFPHEAKELALRFFGRLTHHKGDESWGLDNVIVETVDRAVALDEKQLEVLWAKLSGKDPVAANGALWQIVAGGQVARKFVWKRWNEVLAGEKNKEDPKVAALRAKIAKLVEGLGSEKFFERQVAQRELIKLGGEALQILTEHADGTKDPELRRNLAAVITKLRKSEAGERPERHENVVRSRVKHVMRIFESRNHAYKVSSSPVKKPEGGFDCLAAPADGYAPPGSYRGGVPRYTWFPNRGTSEWLQYDFPEPKTISKAEVFWFTNGDSAGKTALPDSWQVEYQDAAGDWKPLAVKGDYPVEPSKWNTVRFKPVQTGAVRLVVQLREDRTAGVHEFRVANPKPEAP